MHIKHIQDKRYGNLALCEDINGALYLKRNLILKGADE